MERENALANVSSKAPGLSLIGLARLMRSNHCGQINIMLLIGQAWVSCPPQDRRAVSVSHEPHGLRMRRANFGDFLKENQEAISEEGGLDDPRQRKTTDVH